MFASAKIEVGLRADGRPAPTGVEGKYNCPMHPEVITEGPGTCPLCGMDMTKIPGAPGRPGGESLLAVPVSAVLDSGTRRLVYVDRGAEGFVPFDVTLGSRAGEYYPVIAGLKEGDRVAVRGNFLLDSQFQIRGLPSLLHPKGAAQAGGHDGHAAPAPEGHKH
jgi:Cu(I)/Ag(I) efflux system membrane fusion protein